MFMFEYLPYRGVTKEAFAFYDYRTKIDVDGKPLSIGFSYPNLSLKIRTLDKKGFYTQGDISKAGLFGRNKFAASSHKTVTITEGELDALSLYQVIRSPVVSVHSASSAGTDVSLDRSWVNSFERILLAFDGDEAGREAASKVAKLFDYNKVFMVRFPGGTPKEANDSIEPVERDDLSTLCNNPRKF